MASRILLLSINRYEFPYAVYPLGVAYVAAAARGAGHEVRIHDFQCHREPLGNVIREFAPDVVGISLRNIDDALVQRRETFFEELRGLTAELRQHTAARLVLGGSGYSIFPAQLLALAGADFGIQGEGERAFVELIAALESGRSAEGIPGLVHRTPAGVCVNPRTTALAPEWMVTPERPSDLAAFYLQRSSMLNVQTQRGCALRCCYCTYPLLEGRAHRCRPPEKLAEEFAALERQGARYAFIVDSVFNSSARHVMETCEAILRRGLKLRWCCFLRPQGLTAEMLRIMARAGLAHVEFGSDSFCDEVLDAYGKHLTFGEILESSELAREAGVEYCHFLICGGPGETEGTLATTYANSRRLRDATLMARAGMRVYPGTPLFERFKRTQGIPDADHLLEPFYYQAPPLTEAGVLGRLREFARQSPNWIVDDPPPSYLHMAERLRAKGVVGPLWSYFAMLQRLGGGFLPA